MSAQIIDGEAIAGKIKEQLKAQVADLTAKGNAPHLLALMVGDNPATRIYSKSQRKSCEEVGIRYTLEQLPDDTTGQGLEDRIKELNDDASVNGILLQMPLPKGVDARKLQAMIIPGKDVEGMNPANMGMVVYGRPRLAPCTAMGAVELIKATGVELEGKEVTVVGHSEIVGKPVSLLLLDQFCTTTVCHIATRDLAYHTRNAEILVVAVGKAGLIRGDMIRPGAVVIDVGINRVPLKDENGNPVLTSKGKPKKVTVGDVVFDEAKEVASHITPVPGGVGPMTVAILLRNTVEGTKMQLEG
jgi:methylenetetrahydrofolate dehydrogenase (NADP+)/methenyltetrahydrofolate cyclohydrolase